MIYLDYSATTPVEKEVLTSFDRVCLEYVGNPNSLHRLGMEAKHLMDQATLQVAELLQVKPSEIIFTSSASEANSMALCGVVEKYPQRGKHILTTKLEHSSILETVQYLEKKGYEVEYLPLLETGKVDLDALSKMIRPDTILVSIAQVSSEVGVVQDIDAIAEIVHRFPTALFHVDGTQAVGKMPVSLKNIDLYTCSAHKFYGLKGIACLVKKECILMEPLIHGGKSQTIYRSGTPAVALIVSFAKALRLTLASLSERVQIVQKRRDQLLDGLEKLSVVINSPEDAIPHIVNFSLLSIKPETMLHALEQEEIYVSTKTACSMDHHSSTSLLAMGKSEEIASTSLRVSISHLTSEEEIDQFLKVLGVKITELTFR